jgi:hypothetical protein
VLQAQASSYNRSFAPGCRRHLANITPEMGVGFQVPIKNLVLILISTAVKTARAVTELVEVSFPSQV